MGEKTNSKAIPYFFFTILIIVALSLFAILTGINLFLQGSDEGSYWILIGIGTLVISALMLSQTRKAMPQLVFEPERVSTTILCNKCGFKSLRDFQRGDYILKEAEPCPKCNEKMIIASIYREVKEKEKESF